MRPYLEPVSRDDVGVVRAVLEEGINLDPRLESTWERASEWLAPDFEYREDPTLPGAGVHMGIPAFREAVTAYYDAMREMHLEVEECFDAGDRVLCSSASWTRERSCGTHSSSERSVNCSSASTRGPSGAGPPL